MADPSTLFDALRARERRRILFTLCDADSVRLSEVYTRSAAPAEGQSAPTPDGSGLSPSNAGNDDIDLLLAHNHLPKLADAGFVDWDPETRTVSRGPAFAEIEPALRVLAANAGEFPDGLL
jgi:hypothetical protein